jgi:hypothetical protein
LIEGKRKTRQSSSGRKDEAPITIETVPSVVMNGPMIRKTVVARTGGSGAG